MPFLFLFCLLHLLRSLVETGIEKVKANTIGLFMSLGKCRESVTVEYDAATDIFRGGLYQIEKFP